MCIFFCSRTFFNLVEFDNIDTVLVAEWKMTNPLRASTGPVPRGMATFPTEPSKRQNYMRVQHADDGSGEPKRMCFNEVSKHLSLLNVCFHSLFMSGRIAGTSMSKFFIARIRVLNLCRGMCQLPNTGAIPPTLTMPTPTHQSCLHILHTRHPLDRNSPHLNLLPVPLPLK